jgi:hypothetical protein
MRTDDRRCVLCGAVADGAPTGMGGQRTCAVCGWVVGDVPDPDLPPPRVDVVYYIRWDDRVKIGTSSNPRRRLAQLWHQELLAFEPGDRHVEHERHVEFAATRYPGSEWFARSPELDAHIAVLQQGVPDPWQTYARMIAAAYATRT